MIGMSMIRWSFNLAVMAFTVIALTACEKPIMPEDAGGGNVTLTFTANNSDITRAASTNLSAYFTKLNVQVFDAWGEKVFATMKTQTKDDADFGSLTCQLEAGTYTVVAVGHSSIKSATIKSPQMVQFTAADGEKLTDTFCACQQIEVGNDALQQTFQMQRMTAMVQFKLTDENIPESFARMVIGYTGGSANFNPTTSQGTTKSTQSESRPAVSSQVYQVYTFPYLSDAGVLKMTLTAYDAQGNTLRQRVFDAVPVTRNRITTYTGQFFDGTEGNFTQSAFGFTVNGDWDGEDQDEF